MSYRDFLLTLSCSDITWMYTSTGKTTMVNYEGWMDDLHLANCKELQLKSKYDFDTMLHLVQACEIAWEFVAGNWLSELFPEWGFWHLVLPRGGEFDIAKTCFGQKAVPRGWNSAFSRCPRVENLALALVKMSNSPESAPPTLGLNIDKCITRLYCRAFWPEIIQLLILAKTTSQWSWKESSGCPSSLRNVFFYFLFCFFCFFFLFIYLFFFLFQ